MKEETPEVYEKIAYHFSNTRQYTWVWVEKFLNEIQDKKIVYDIGCGNGRNMCDRLTMIGVDSCKEFLKICASKNKNVCLSCMTNLPFKSESCDAIICIASFHHLKTLEHRTKALFEMKRVLKKNATLLLSVWSKTQPQKTRRTFENYGDTIVKWDKYGNEYYRYYYIFKPQELIKLVQLVGLRVEKHEYNCGNEILYIKNDLE